MWSLSPAFDHINASCSFVPTTQNWWSYKSWIYYQWIHAQTATQVIHYYYYVPFIAYNSLRNNLIRNNYLVRHWLFHRRSQILKWHFRRQLVRCHTISEKRISQTSITKVSFHGQLFENRWHRDKSQRASKKNWKIEREQIWMHCVESWLIYALHIPLGESNLKCWKSANIQLQSPLIGYPNGLTIPTNMASVSFLFYSWLINYFVINMSHNLWSFDNKFLRVLSVRQFRWCFV